MSSKEVFINWVGSFRPLTLQNEAEVETRFIIPLFQHLGYGDEYRRDKYPLKTYSPGKQGRKPEIDLIYFSVDSPNEQNANTSLIIVEAKEPGRTTAELAEDLNQAKYYAYHLKPPILVVTNGRHITVVRERPSSWEVVFDDSVDSLKNEETAAFFFEQLNFQVVKAIKDTNPTESRRLNFDDYSPPVPMYFCGREEELSRLRVDISHHSIIVIGGIAGVGKSYLAAQLTSELRESYPIIWLSFEPQTSLEHYLSGLAYYLKNTFNDQTLLNTIQAPHVNEGQRINVATKLLDTYGCLLVWDNFKQSANKSFLPFLTACGRHLEKGRLLITTKEWIGLEETFNLPYYLPTLTSLKEKDGIELMQRLCAGELQLDVLKQAYDRVGGHPHLLTLLAGLSKLFALTDLLEHLPHVPDKISEYIQQKVLDTLEPDAGQLLYGLSLLEIPFQLSAINHLASTADKYQAFDKLLNRFLVTHLGQQSTRYDIHELVKTFCRSQLPHTSLSSFHKNLHAYYNALSDKSYVDGRMLVYHALEGELIDEAYEALKNLLSSALYDGMYDFILEYISTVLKDDRVKKWGFVYYTLGRVLRFKVRYAEARDAYEAALQFGKDIDESERAKFELSSILTFLSETREDVDVELARGYFSELLDSANPETRLRAITALGTLSIRERKGECIAELKDALALAEQIGAWISVFQLCICLGQAHEKIRTDHKEAINYLERALKIQEEHIEDLGGQNAEGLYITHLELAKLYEVVGRFADAVDSWKVCVEINRRLGLSDRLAETLHYLGRAQLKIDNRTQARDSFLESTALINENKLQDQAPPAHIEWLALSLWECGDYERAIEYMMELSYLSEVQGLKPRPMLILREADARSKSEIIKLREKGAFILVLPSAYSLSDVNKWETQVKRRRPEFATLEMTTLQKKSPSNPTSGASAERKVGRNEPCPCGSRRKFKKCCGLSL